MTNSWQTWLARALLSLLFVASLFYLLYSANGYSYDFIGNQLRKTGIIEVVYSDPQARVYLDGKELQGTLPFAASNVLPGKYDLVVARPDYWDYHLEVEVQPDLISRINSVFLYPMNALSKSKKIMQWRGLEYPQVMMEDGYIWKIGRTQLEYARLRKVLTDADFKKAAVPDCRISSIQVYANEALLACGRDRRFVLNLTRQNLEEIKQSSSYIFAGDKWLYFKGDVLAALDRNFNRVIWAKQPRTGVRISGVDYLVQGGRQFVILSFAGSDGGNAGADSVLYELQNDRLLVLDEGKRLSGLRMDFENSPVYVKDNLEVWRINNKTGLPQMLSRMQQPVEIVSANVSVHGARNQLVLKVNDQYLLSDYQMDNVRPMFPVKNTSAQLVTAVELLNQQVVYFIQENKTADQKSQLFELNYLDLEE